MEMSEPGVKIDKVALVFFILDVSCGISKSNSATTRKSRLTLSDTFDREKKNTEAILYQS